MPLALSWAQQRLWFLDQFDGAGSAYHIAGALRLRGTLDHAALQATLDRIVARHEVLRTTFDGADGAAVQVIAPLLRRQQMLQSSLQQLPSAAAGGVASSATTPVPITALDRTMVANLICFFMVNITNAISHL